MAGIPDTNTEYVAWSAPTCPINTPATSPLTTVVNFPGQSFLWQVNIRIPPGHAGYTGIAVTDSNSFLVPFANPGPAWIIGDDDNLWFDYGQEVQSSVTLAYYNTSTDFAHGWQVRLVYTPMSVFTSTGDVIVTPDVADWAQAIEGTTGG